MLAGWMVNMLCLVM